MFLRGVVGHKMTPIKSTPLCFFFKYWTSIVFFTLDRIVPRSWPCHHPQQMLWNDDDDQASVRRPRWREVDHYQRTKVNISDPLSSLLPSGLYGGKPALKEDLSGISGHFYLWTKVYNTYWTNLHSILIKGPSPTVNFGVWKMLGHRYYQRTKVSVSDDPSQPCSMSHHNAVQFYGLRTQVPWTKGTSASIILD